ncbi:MAG: hypothetical protein U1F87_18620 [Kiritimatiellia bacterium]
MRTDMAGIAHFARYFLWMEAAEHGSRREIGIPVRSRPWLTRLALAARRLLFPVPSACPLRDQVEVALDLINVGNTSLTFRCEIWHAGEKIASGETTCVCCKAGAAGAIEKISIPEDVRARLTASPPGLRTIRAGEHAHLASGIIPG